MKFTGKVVIITGATSGIGLATAKLFIEKGCSVYGIARKPYCGNDFKCYSASVCDYEEIKRIFGEIYEREGKIDVFINNAGIGVAGAMEEASAERIREIADVNLTAPCVLSGTVLPYMKAGAKIINISSVGGIMPIPYQSVYSATKAGVEVFSRALANEVRPQKIKVCTVLPGDTKTGFTDARVCEGTDARARKSVEKMARDERRGKSPESVARVVYKVAQRKNPPLRVTVGGGYKLLVFLQRLLPVKLVNFIIREIYC
mgnify:CR=1 FL=1